MKTSIIYFGKHEIINKQLEENMPEAFAKYASVKRCNDITEMESMLYQCSGNDLLIFDYDLIIKEHDWLVPLLDEKFHMMSIVFAINEMNEAVSQDILDEAGIVRCYTIDEFEVGKVYDFCYYMLRQVSIGRTAIRAKEKSSKEYYTVRIRERMRELGFNPSYSGTDYIVDAVALLIEKREESIRVTRDIYPIIADKYHVTTAGVEKGIRLALDQAWAKYKNKENANYKAFPGYDVVDRGEGKKIGRKPTNYRFLRCIIDDVLEAGGI